MQDMMLLLPSSLCISMKTLHSVENFATFSALYLVLGEGYGRCWWARPGAAELPDQDALALRQHHKRQLQIRRLIPRVMLQLTSPQTESDQSAAAGKEAAGAAADEARPRSGDMRFTSPVCTGMLQPLVPHITSLVKLGCGRHYHTLLHLERACCIKGRLSSSSCFVVSAGLWNSAL